MNWVNNFAQLKYYEELAGLIIFGISFAGYLVYFGILYLRDFLNQGEKIADFEIENCYYC